MPASASTLHTARIYIHTYCCCVCQHVDEVEVEGERYLPCLKLLLPGIKKHIAELLVEGTGIGQESRRKQNITNQADKGETDRYL